MNNRVNFIFRTLSLCLVVCVSTAVTFAQSVKHKCEVYIFDLSVSTSQIKTLGDFNIAVKNGNSTTKFYKLPDTKLIISATVSYSTEDLSKADVKSVPPDKVFMVLILGKKGFNLNKDIDKDIDIKKAKKDILSVVVAIMSLESFKEEKVMTMYLGKRQPVEIFLECRKPN